MTVFKNLKIGGLALGVMFAYYVLPIRWSDWGLLGFLMTEWLQIIVMIIALIFVLRFYRSAREKTAAGDLVSADRYRQYYSASFAVILVYVIQITSLAWNSLIQPGNY
jgi:heme/copper-type cytochrome/quinol oxidase subunit 2